MCLCIKGYVVEQEERDEVVAGLGVNVRWGPGVSRRTQPPPTSRGLDKGLFSETPFVYTLQSEVSFTV